MEPISIRSSDIDTAIEGLDNITLRIFEGADHGYTWPVAPTYHEEAATVGWAATTEMFDRVLA